MVDETEEETKSDSGEKCTAETSGLAEKQSFNH